MRKEAKPHDGHGRWLAGPKSPWPDAYWEHVDRTTRMRILDARDNAAWDIAVKEARRVLQTYSTSFFTVTRFLPLAKRQKVEAIYAAVRYPDEIVDTFPLSPGEKCYRLDQWQDFYDRGLSFASLREAVAAGTPCFLAGFLHVVRHDAIPPEHYRSFLAAMRCDAAPRLFETMDDLIDSYVYGSAVVVGYFLAHVYGSSSPGRFAETLEVSKKIGIALQLTNFLRDIQDDRRMGRIYLPADMLREEGLSTLALATSEERAALGRVVRRIATHANDLYREASDRLFLFSDDSRAAIRACIDVYGQLNARIATDWRGDRRESVPAWKKFRVLPPSKYWRLPLAYLGW
ncbi:MAG TPA: phytoene/squalene synthase family protein [Candidatus Hydrogenedentes bacterium]|nr:phytoene/squalene synthase family protein [Candidatus Hydrogenedentota bacterium]HOS01495.1 phytoene/squalene synthase family protein [Candidatus Hydrogenedentota bacterium]